ncbi:PAS domain-containing serine/threonine-protein kinase [Galemys pyrenaicus]|uniref:PAS domain-containing serine/threonine-protein kinase n=1 Tax=Galemys pyrenaicus TaxID=202257 RepID=A0A8J6DH30_GALPY|nr:PAS domain-containing serine/threonine-protein kinase [Galemys pyrenaicus]
MSGGTSPPGRDTCAREGSPAGRDPVRPLARPRRPLARTAHHQSRPPLEGVSTELPFPMEDGGPPASGGEQAELGQSLLSSAPTDCPPAAPSKSLPLAHRPPSRRHGLAKLCQSRMALSEDRWSSYCLSSLAAQSICACRLLGPASPEQPALGGSLASTSCCSLLQGLSSGWPAPLLPAPVCNPNKAVFTVHAKTTEVPASGRRVCG